MPTDLRKLIFSRAELRLTFQQYCKDKGIGPENAPLESFEVAEGGAGRVVSEDHPEELRVILKYTSHDPNNPVRAHLREEQVLEALIFTCKALGIPLPRRGRKFLQKTKDGLSMTIGMTEQDLRMAKTG